MPETPASSSVPDEAVAHPRGVIPGLRRLFVVAGALVLMVGSSLFFYTSRPTGTSPGPSPRR